MNNYLPKKLLEYNRDGLIEQEHYGIIVFIDKNRNVKKIGEDLKYPFYLRSCAKPLQASLIVDYNLISHYKMTDEEIAICCASHAGESCHVNTNNAFLKKIEIDKKYLKCGFHKPLSKEEQNKLILSGEKEDILQNNCSGKHSMMLAICKKMGWDITNYDNKEHPLQKAIKNKIYELCEIDDNFHVTKDGCGVPIFAVPLENMVIGFLNLFLSDKYSKITKAIQNNPYLIGGVDRLDTAIMLANHDLIAKVGAGGLCIAVNLKENAGVIIKIMDSDMKARAICLIEALHQLGWLSDSMLETNEIKKQNQKEIITLHGEVIGKAQTTFNLDISN